MNERVLRMLEFHKIVDRLKGYADTSLGKELVSQVTPSPDFNEVRQLQAETDEAAQVIRLNKTVPLGGIFDVRASLKRTVIGGVLSARECLDIASTIYGGRQVKHAIERLEGEFPLLKELVEQITPLRSLEQQITYCIDEDGNLHDHASPTLKTIRSSIRSYETQIRDRLNQFIRTKSKFLSDQIMTIRNDRYVLPIKHEYRSAIGGIVHDQSASGQTLFMEPRVVVELNNQLQATRAKEKQEIERILRELSDLIASEEPALQVNLQALAEIDFIFARAKLAHDMRAVKPILNDRGIIKMRQARHPLIPEDDVVANDIEIGESFTAMVITGPNTGGKTVVLKTIGLCTLMAQSGLQIPALDGCQMAVFEKVFADIGDEQSIEQSLSTFSSHMTNIVSIMEEVNDKTLVLFDELGAGTDPQEGAALAMAILDEVIARDARVVATTHYPELKAYGYNRENVINASVEFDIETLQPTYRLLIGVPGRSNAFDISKRLGLDEHIIQRARQDIGIETKSVENMIASLEKAQKQAEREYEEAHQILRQSEQLLADLKKAWQRYEHHKEMLYRTAEEKAEEAVQKAREEAEEIVAEIRKMKANVGFKEHEWIEAKRMLDEAQPQLTVKEQEALAGERRDTTSELKPGDDIKLITLNQPGTVIEKINDREYFVQVGSMRLKAKRENLELIAKKQEPTHEPVAMVKSTAYHIKPELDLRGERFEDALARLEKYIDAALLAGYPSVTIIHGKGTGALRKGVQEFAKQHPRITSYRSGSMEEGGSGVTVIQF